MAASAYNCLAEFVGDVTRIVENTRYFNPQVLLPQYSLPSSLTPPPPPPLSSISTSATQGTKVAAAAEVLEQLLARQIPAVRERVAAQAT